MGLRWGAAWDSARARHAAAGGAQHGAAQGRSMWLCMGATWSRAGGQRGIEQGGSVSARVGVRARGRGGGELSRRASPGG